MTRNGKIARLSKKVRDSLNVRLQDGEPGPKILQWLNGLYETQDMLDCLFDSRPINEQNLSEWRQGGYQDYLRDQQTTERVQRLAERAQDIDKASDGVGFADRLSSLLAAELADVIEKLGEIADPNERWRRLQEVSRELQRLRSEDHNARRVQMHQADWQRERDREKEKKEKQAENKEKNELIHLFWASHHQPLVVKSLGGGEYGEKWADWLFRLENDLPMPDWWQNRKRGTNGTVFPAETTSNQTESNQIKPDQTGLDPAAANGCAGQQSSSAAVPPAAG